MAGNSRALQKYFRTVDEANAALAQRWQAITKHLPLGLAMPVPTASILLRAFEAPKDYVGADGRRHRKPVRALYGLGDSAKQRFEDDSMLYQQQSAILKSQVDSANEAVVQWAARAQAGDVEAIRWYCRTVLPFIYPTPPAGVAYLASGYSADERHLVLERLVPGMLILPVIDHYEISRRLEFRKIPISDGDRAAWYGEFLSQIALLTIDRTFRSEIGQILTKVTVNLRGSMQNPATGNYENVYLLSVGMLRSQFIGLNLLGVDPATCVRSLNGRITPHPGLYAPILPWVTADATGSVHFDVRGAPLLEMAPADLEILVAELMRRMGLRVEHTGMTGDGGVDCIAYDDRPVIGGRVIVQVKRYTNTVNPSVVRDLFGTLHASGASKGVLVTTSGFGPESREFAQGKPLELIDGVQLDSLLRSYRLVGTMTQPSELLPEVELQQNLAPVSPDGRYYWDGAAWQPIVGQ